jgi:hypothetical protein
MVHNKSTFVCIQKRTSRSTVTTDALTKVAQNQTRTYETLRKTNCTYTSKMTSVLWVFLKLRRNSWSSLGTQDPRKPGLISFLSSTENDGTLLYLTHRLTMRPSDTRNTPLMDLRNRHRSISIRKPITLRRTALHRRSLRHHCRRQRCSVLRCSSLYTASGKWVDYVPVSCDGDFYHILKLIQNFRLYVLYLHDQRQVASKSKI